MISVTLINGSPSSASSARAMGWLGTRRPMVRFFGCSNSRGTSRVALRIKVYGPGKCALSRRKVPVSILANSPNCDRSLQMSAKLCLSSS
ncbi:hypothetical protein D3C76_1452290 [compost metagenome]